MRNIILLTFSALILSACQDVESDFYIENENDILLEEATKPFPIITRNSHEVSIIDGVTGNLQGSHLFDEVDFVHQIFELENGNFSVLVGRPPLFYKYALGEISREDWIEFNHIFDIDRLYYFTPELELIEIF